MDNVKDIIFIGAGPVGLFGTFYSGMRGMSAKIIDLQPQLGGQLAALYPHKYIYDIPGYTKVYAGKLIEELIKQTMQFEPEICLNEKVLKLEYDSQDESIIKLSTDKGNVHLGRSVIISAGAGAFMPRKLDIQKLHELENRGCYYFVKDPQTFKDKEVVIVGGGDSAVDWTLTLEKVAKKVTLVHRADKFQAHEDSVNKLYDSSADVFAPYELKEVHGGDGIEEVTIVSHKSQEEIRMNCDTILCCIGFITNLGPIQDWGIDLESNAIKVNQTMGTNIKGVWAAGDIITYPGKLKIIATGFADAAIAVNMAKHRVHPE